MLELHHLIIRTNLMYWWPVHEVCPNYEMVEFVPRLRPSIPKTHLPTFSHQSLPEANSPSPPSPPPRLSDSRQRRSKIYYDFIGGKYRVLHMGITSVGYFDIIIYHLLYVCFIITKVLFPNDSLFYLSLNLASIYH